MGLPVALSAGRDARRASRCSTGWPTTRSTTTRTSSAGEALPRAGRARARRLRGPGRRGCEALPADCQDAETIQNEVYEAGKAAGFEPLRAWFPALYEVLLGQSQGPRFGSFAAIFGLEKTIGLIERALAGELASAG